MSNESESDLLTRALGGDDRARTELYEKFIYSNARVRRLAKPYPNVNDFLHDCFCYVLAAGSSFSGKARLDNWVESVAECTALERERLRRSGRSGAGNPVRMCAAGEGDVSLHRAPFASYFPPGAGAADSLTARISAIVGEPQVAPLRLSAMENSTWENVAAAAGKSVNAVAPPLVRAIERLSRFFGAPPPLNDDLERVFSCVTASHKPTGRVLSMQLDSAFYTLTPDMRKIGLSVPHEVRTITLWEAARMSTPPHAALREHLAKCDYCSEVLRSLLLMQQALLSGAKTDFLFCPGACTLLRNPDEVGGAVTEHLARCAECCDEQARGDAEEERAHTPTPAVAGSGVSTGKKIAAAAAVILIGIGVFFAYRHSTKRAEPPTAGALEMTPVSLTVKPSPKYADLVELVSLDDPKLLDSVLPPDQFEFMEALADLKGGKWVEAKVIAEHLANASNDPAAEELYAVCLYGERLDSQAYRALLTAEAIAPRNGYRCWALLQSALRFGDKTISEREIEHLSSDPNYGVRARNVLAKMRTRQ